MKTFLLFITAFIFVSILKAQHNDLLWVNQISGNGNSKPTAVIEDASGNLYVIGNYTQTISQGTYTFTSAGGQDIYVGKYNSQGQVQWLISIGGSSAENAYGIALSPDGNSVYIGGQFQSNNCNFGGTTLATSGLNDVFLAKYNASNGTLVWAIKSAYGTNQQIIGHLNVDNQGNVIQIGKYIADVTFYGGTTTLTSLYSGIQQNYISKFDQDGNLLWAKTFKGNNNNSLLRTATSDNNSYYFSGQFTDSLYLDAFALNSTSSTRDMVLFRTDLNGNVQWVRKVTGSGDEFLYRHYTDFSSYQYVAGYYASPTLTIDSTSSDVSLKICPNQGSNDILVACYAFDGTLQWVRNYGSTGDDKATGVYANAEHAIFTGSYTGNITFGSYNLTNNSTDAFMLETDRNGNVLGVNNAWGTGNDYCENGKINANNANTFVGYFYSGTFNIGNKTLTNGTPATTDMFMAKYGKINIAFTTTNNVCFGDHIGSIDVTVSGDGTAPYTYAWSGPNGFTSSDEDISNLYAGWYKVTVTDANNAQKVDSTYISEGTAMALVFNTQSTSCYGVNDGSINLTVTGGASPYTYNWSTGSTQEDINGLAPGWYYVTVTDANNCTKNDSTKVLSAQPIIISELITPPSCTPGNDGSIDLSINGGTPNYSFIWSNGQTTEDIINISAGNFSVTVTDANNCSSIKSFNVANPLAPSISYIVNAPSCNPGNDGTIDLIISGGTIPFTYVWDNGSNSEDLSGLSAGNYSVTVVDNNNCSSVASNIIVPISNTPSLTTIIQKPGCNPGNDGSIDLIVYNGTAPFTYNWNNGATTEDISNLAAGNYSVTVTDNKNCTAVQSVTLTIDSPVVNITYHGNTTFCEGDSLMLYATNGSNLTYEWYNGSTSIINSNTPILPAYNSGNYYVVATNSVGCKGYSDTVTITVNPKPNITINASSNFICEGTPILLTANGGVSYLWSNSSTTNPITVIPTSTTTYAVTGTDANGCFNVAQVAITVNANPSIAGAITHETCAANTGAIDLTITGGNAPYSFIWSNSATTEDLSNIAAGNYAVTVTSATNCTSTYTAVVNAFVPLSATINTHTMVLFCSNVANGEVHVTATNGSQPYSYQWSNGVTTSYNNQIGVGTTYVTVTDQCNTTVVDSIVATSLPPMQASIINSSPASCSTSANGTAEVSASSGIAPYTYVWSNSISTTNIANDLPVGWQYVTVSDYCSSIVDSVEITSLPPMQASISFSAPVSCVGLNNGLAMVSITDGVAPFSFVWSNGENTQTATQLPQGLNSVTVTDACGWVVLSVNTGLQNPMSLSMGTPTPVSCINSSNGSATINVYDGAGPFTYVWSSGDTLATATHLTYGWNYVTVTDACSTLTDSVNIDVIPPVQADITFTVDASCSNSNDGKATVNVQNGVAPFTYAWSNSSSTSNVALDLHPGWNYVTVTDQCGSSVDSVEISYKMPLQAIISYNQATDCVYDSTGMVIVTPAYGVQPYSYAWSYGTDTDSILQNLPVGNYFVTVSDFCGSVVVPFSVSNKTPLSIDYQKENVSCFGNNNGSIVLIPQNGVAPYTYVWQNSIETDSIRTNLSAGIYKFTITDKCGSVSDSVIIRQPGQLSASALVTNVSFEGLSDGKVDLLVFGGTQPYSYNWSNGAVTEDISNIIAGTYYVTISDDNGCILIDSVVVNSEGKHIEIYNSFTPNGDGKNDVWNIKYIQAFPNCEVLIYDQWGVKVFESNGYATPWDGKKGGKDLPAATYYYVIDLNDGSQPLTGSVTIIK
ncbi:MAG: gliding motility-associated C-terminal domain-containing protein [Bacteroidales bacterium]|nr:gliding motility-associated C-terminal domain-containing protein [Bacteroidales bacterium]